MGKFSYKITRIEFIFEDELTKVDVSVEAIGDCPINVQGSHKATFPASRLALDILQNEITKQEFLFW